jgi:hypothetical protein
MFISSVLTGYLQISKLARISLGMSRYEDPVPYLESIENCWMKYAEDADDVLPTP